MGKNNEVKLSYRLPTLDLPNLKQLVIKNINMLQREDTQRDEKISTLFDHSEFDRIQYLFWPDYIEDIVIASAVIQNYPSLTRWITHINYCKRIYIYNLILFDFEVINIIEHLWSRCETFVFCECLIYSSKNEFKFSDNIGSHPCSIRHIDLSLSWGSGCTFLITEERLDGMMSAMSRTQLKTCLKSLKVRDIDLSKESVKQILDKYKMQCELIFSPELPSVNLWTESETLGADDRDEQS